MPKKSHYAGCRGYGEAKDGKIVYQKAVWVFYLRTGDSGNRIIGMTWLLIIKIASTMIAVMKLVDEWEASIEQDAGRLFALDLRGTDKAGASL